MHNHTRGASHEKAFYPHRVARRVLDPAALGPPRSRCAGEPWPVRRRAFPDLVPARRPGAVRARGGDAAFVLLPGGCQGVRGDRRRRSRLRDGVLGARDQPAAQSARAAVGRREPQARARRRPEGEGGRQDRARARLAQCAGTGYAGYDTVPTTKRSERYEQAMERLAAKYPDDKEAAIFYALALLEAVDHADKTYARQTKAGAILEPIDRAQPNHPGLAHYIIHAYDFEPLAARGVSAADKYAKVAPSAPHAQHMPSHIYSILGRWEDSIRSNQAAVKASREYAAKNAPGTTFAQEPHAQDFMAYAHLQLGQNREAKRVVDELGAITKFSGARNYGRDTGQAAPAVRYVLERAAWSEALALPVRTDAFAYAQAMPRFVRAVGAAKLGKPDVAKEEISHLQALSKAGENSYWAEQVHVLVLAAGGWQARAEGRNDEALKLMRAAADLEDSTEKHVAMENRLYPMREMLGDLLLETGQPALALQAYEASMHAAPNHGRPVALDSRRLAPWSFDPAGRPRRGSPRRDERGFRVRARQEGRGSERLDDRDPALEQGGGAG